MHTNQLNNLTVLSINQNNNVSNNFSNNLSNLSNLNNNTTSYTNGTNYTASKQLSMVTPVDFPQSNEKDASNQVLSANKSKEEVRQNLPSETFV